MSNIIKKQTSGNCRLCKTNTETIHNILSNCPVLAKNQYIERHNKIGKRIYKAILQSHNIILTNNNNKIDKIYEDENIKIYWDFPITTRKTIAANRPDLIYINKSNKTCTLFDFSLPWDTRINEKYGEKVSKYLPLASAMKYQMNLKSVTIQPIIVGCLGSFSNRMKTELQNLHINITMEQLQVTAIEESSKILRFVLNIE